MTLSGKLIRYLSSKPAQDFQALRLQHFAVMKKLRLLRNLMIDGNAQPIDSIVEVSDTDAKYIVARGAAVIHLEGDTNGDGKLDAKEKKAKKGNKPEEKTNTEAKPEGESGQAGETSTTDAGGDNGQANA